MPIELKVHGTGGSAEHDAAVTLAEFFRESLPESAVGRIDLCPNLKLPGQKRKDIDLLVVGVVQGVAPPVEIELEGVFREFPLNISSFAFVVEV